jgi:hypothetical protein
MFCLETDLLNESDVEQKFLMPLLLGQIPNGLGYNAIDFRTKADIRRLKLDKGNNEKLYRPDYVVVIAGVPVFVIEAKHPNEDPDSALREARLYGVELNSSYPHTVNPCVRVIASNGRRTVSAPIDSQVADVELSFADCNPTSSGFARFVELVSKTAAQSEADRIRDRLTKRPLHRAVDYVGGQTARNEDVGYNDFGSKLALDFRHVFNPESRRDRVHIVRNAYVPSQRREHYVDEIDRIIQSAIPNPTPGVKRIKDTANPTEIISALRAGRSLENEIILLVGPRGAGKTTFVDYCREVKLPPDILRATVWVHLNLNNAPFEKSLRERWLLEQTIESLTVAHPDVDFEKDIQKVFAVEISKLKRGPLAVLDPNSESFQVRIADQLLSLLSDPLAHAKAMVRYLAAERGKTLVVVFDNCDKRERDQQLHAFESARWLQQQIRCVVFLPIRDVTYELYRNEPPLDTMIKDLVFRIDPPSFTSILSKRLDLILAEVTRNSKEKMLEFKLDNGIPVRYPATEIGFYLASIFKSLYGHDRLIRSLIHGLAGKDIRRAMEIFLEFCRSGHISSSEYLKIKAEGGQYCLPYTVVSRVLLRRNRRFYDSEASFIKNLFFCHPGDAKPDMFVRADILEWLRHHFKDIGPTGIKGFHQCNAIIADLMPLGHDADRTRIEIDYLIQCGCIIAEHQRRKLESDLDLLRLSPSGFVHLNLVTDISYLAACSEETWIENEALAQSIAARIAKFGPKIHYSALTVAANASDFISYLDQQQQCRNSPSHFLESGFSGVQLNSSTISHRAQNSIKRAREVGGWDDLKDNFAVGMETTGTVDGVQDYGVFIKLDCGPTGLIYFKNLPADVTLSSFRRDDRVVVEVMDIQIESKKISLKYLRPEHVSVTL